MWLSTNPHHIRQTYQSTSIPHPTCIQRSSWLCVDYRCLNAMTFMDAYPMLRTDEIINKWGKVKYITILDLASGYWQVHSHVERRQAQDCVHCSKGIVPVQGDGLRPQWSPSHILKNNVWYHSRDWRFYCSVPGWHPHFQEQHLEHIREVIQRLRKSKLTAKKWWP